MSIQTTYLLSVVQTKVIKTPQIEKRKLIRIGKTSLGVILPKAWLTYFSLQAGDEVELLINGQITITPPVKTAFTDSSMELQACKKNRC